MNYEILKHVIITSPQTTGPHTCPGPYQREVWVCCRLSLSTSWAYSTLHWELAELSRAVGSSPLRLWAREGKNRGLESHVWLERWDWQSQAGVEDRLLAGLPHTLYPSVWRVTAVPTGNGQCWGRGEEVTRRMGRLRKILALKGWWTIAGEETQDIQTVPGLSREPSVSMGIPL